MVLTCKQIIVEVGLSVALPASFFILADLVLLGFHAFKKLCWEAVLVVQFSKVAF